MITIKTNLLLKKSTTDEKDDNYQTNEENFNAKSLKAMSPFTKVFSEIVTSCEISVESETESGQEKEENEYFNPGFIYFLQEKYTPYCFIWSSFTLINLGITRETNGNSLQKNVSPHNYVFDTYKSVIGNCKEFLSKEKKKLLILNKKKKSRESDFQNVSKSEEAWSKKQRGNPPKKKKAIKTLNTSRKMVKNQAKEFNKVLKQQDQDVISVNLETAIINNKTKEKVEIENITDLNVNKNIVSKNMIQDLLDGKWLSATLIEAYISCNKKSNKTLIIPDSIGQKIILSGQFHSKNKRIFLNKVDFNAYESIISFINIGGHWNLMYASKTGTFIYFDPDFKRIYQSEFVNMLP
ncbi:hypothetical protein BpHYR1_037705, partial [Brachionus plicatilis]